MRYSVSLIARLISEDVDDFNGVDSTVFIRNGLIPLDFSEAGVVDFDFNIDPDEKDLLPILKKTPPLSIQSMNQPILRFIFIQIQRKIRFKSSLNH